MRRCNLSVGLFLQAASVLSLKSDALNTTTSCTGNETFPYLDRETQSLVDLPCANVCPPIKSTDREILFCYKNCREFLQCQLGSQSTVLTSLQQQQQRLLNVPKTCLSLNDTFFFHPKHKFTSCRSACSNNRGNKFCSRNCPDYYTLCVKPNRTSTTRVTGGVHQPTTTAGSSNRSPARPTLSTSSRSIVSGQTPTYQSDNTAPRPLSSQQRQSRTRLADDLHADDSPSPSEEVKSSSAGYSPWFLATVIPTAIVISIVLVILIICLGLPHCRRRRLAEQNIDPRLVPGFPANTALLHLSAYRPETNVVAATTQDSSLRAINTTVDSASVPNVNPEYQHLSIDPLASGPCDFKSDDELEQMLLHV